MTRPATSSARRTRPAHPTDRRRREHGFTLIELLVTVSIVAIVVRVAVVNIYASIPSAVLDGEATKLASQVDYIRSEARLQSQTMRLEIDIDNNQFQTVLPPELRTRSDQLEQEEASLGWQAFDERVEITGVQIPGEPIFRTKIVPIPIDSNGLGPDFAVFFRFVNDELVWTLRVSGISGSWKIEQNFEGDEQPMREINEGAF